MALKIAIVVPGRFHAFELVRELLQRGHDVKLFTDYPKWALERFGVPRRYVASLWPEGIAKRIAWSLSQKRLCRYPESWLRIWFGRWAASRLVKEPWDIVHCWSGCSEEILRRLDSTARLTLLMRGSAHIRTQARLLEEEESRTGVPQERPSPWIIAREEREYALADAIAVLSTFARRTFIAEGIPPEKLLLLPLGTRLEAFCPTHAVVEARCQRILAGEPLRVLYVGAVSFRKGMWDLSAIIRTLSDDSFCFRCVGPLLAEAAQVASALHDRATFMPKRPQSELPSIYAWGDVFLFPTIEDGYAIVLAQAAASGLPILTTTNCAGPDLIREGDTGWILPIRNPEAFIERLQWCAAHRTQLAAMAHRIPAVFRPRDWADVAADFETLCLASLRR
jgi:glycosyltransferase involved in cell wall biosynthesis